MEKELTYFLEPHIAFNDENLNGFLKRKLKLGEETLFDFTLLKRSIDARKNKVRVFVKLKIYMNEEKPALFNYTKPTNKVSENKKVIIIGAGPAGLFAALRLIELGVKPVIIERGKDVRRRRRDIANINKQHIVNPNSNYCFGEGGAGTYSDGKLYTRSKKRGDFRRILEIFVANGASDNILVDAHPHIGTNKLPKIIEEIRATILNAGGEIHFDQQVVDFTIDQKEIKGVACASGEEFAGDAVILATGHSARDIFRLCDKKGVRIESKAFALGVRVEHQQSLIDQIQYSLKERGEYLPAASYSISSQVKVNNSTTGVFSFCMCPGGFIVPSATQEGEIVVNGMSPSRRNSKYANSGIVVSVDPEKDTSLINNKGALSALEFQEKIEKTTCSIAGGTQTAPAQRLVDFVSKKLSSELNETSYQPGLKSIEMDAFLPKEITDKLRIAFKAFGKKMKGFLTNEAQIVGVESRTSSPVKIPRSKENLEHVEIKRLFPCGEGAGYAGGIASAAMDGERCAEMVVKTYFSL